MSYARKISNFVQFQSQLIKKRDFLGFFRGISGYFPRWMFKVNSGTIMKTSAPRIVFRKYKNYIFTVAKTDDISEIAKFTNIQESTLSRRMEFGDVCHIARDITDNDKIVNVIWMHIGPCYIMGLGLRLDVPADSVYLYGGYTADEARMKGIFNTAFKIVYDTLTSQGISNIYGLIEGWNPKAYNFHLRINFKPIGRMIFFIIMFVKFAIYTDLETGRKKIRIFIFFPKDQVLI